MKGVFTVVVLALETNFYLVILSCARAHLMGRFSVDDNYGLLRRCKILGISDMCFSFLVWWRMVQAIELDRGTRLQEASRFPS